MPLSVRTAQKADHRSRVSEQAEYLHKEKANGYFD